MTEKMTSKFRAQLRAQANTLEPLFQVGKGDIDETLVQGVLDCLKARELIKATVLQNAPMTAREACEALCERVHAEPIQVIGSKFVIYRKARKDSKIDLDNL